jgi:penicillin-binding protein 1C
MIRRLLIGAGAATALLATAALALDRAFPPDLSRLRSTGTQVLDRQGRTVALLPAPGGVWRFSPGAVAPVFTDLLVAVEDRRFALHPGVDPLAALRAAVQWARAGHVVSGGSTLAMQAARLLEPRPRTLRAKAIEAFRAVQLEARYGRAGVLDIWVTLAPFGGNVEGVRAASWAWFGVPPERLEPAQAALLVAIPRRPEALRPDRHVAAARLVRDRVLAVGARDGLFAAEAAPDPPTVRTAMPRHAAQAVASLAPDRGTVSTTLDLPLQAALERLAAQRLAALPERAAIAMLVADAQGGAIRAVYGGAWGDGARAGALDLTRRVRSPGSALKPFIYAMAFADGLAGPETVLADLPHRFGDYAPENFDRGFAGGITAAEALRRSLNLPAVALLDRVGPQRFAAELGHAGASLVRPPGAPASLPLALGGAGISMRDAVALYAALAGDGRATRLRLRGDAATPLPFLQADAARSVARVLTRPFPGGGPEGVAWKTGTSWGGRDAWAFGFDASRVAAVWIGRPDGTPLPGATGTSLALPMLARVFGLLPAAPRATTRVPAAQASLAPADPAADADALRLLFPPPGAQLSGEGPVAIRAMGGRRPLAFLVDGAPLADVEPARRQAAWRPAGPGFYHLTVLDADGAAARAVVRVR